MLLNREVRRVYISIILFAFALRMWGINARSLWFDESFEYWASIVGLRNLPATAVTSFQPPLYNFLLHFWLSFASDAIWLRFLSLAFSILALLGIMILGHGLFGIKGAVVSGLLIAIMPVEIKYAQEAAEYALMSFALSWSLLALFRALRNSTWKAWALWGIFCAIAVYSHYGASITVFALSVIVFVENMFRQEFDKARKQAIVTIIGLFLGLPLLYFVTRQFPAQGRDVAVLATSFFSEIKMFIESTGQTFLFPLTGMPFSSIPTWVPLLSIGSILLLSFILLKQNNDSRRLFVWFWGAYLAYYLTVRMSLYAYGNYGFRYMLILLPLFVLLIVATILRLVESRNLLAKATAVALLFFIVALAAYSLPNRSISERTRGYTAWPETQDMREVILFWSQHPSHDAPTYIYYGAAPAFRYYARSYDIEPEISLPPAWYSSCWQGLPFDYCIADNVYYGAWFRSFSLEDKVSSIQQTFGAMPETFWLVFSHIYADEDRAVVESLLSDYQVEDEYRQVNAVAYLLTEK